MTDVFYTPPKADLQDGKTQAAAYFVVAPSKLLVMLFMTHGLYGAYWLYRNWASYRDQSGRSIWPLARTILSLFYVPSLFCKIDRTVRESSKEGMSYWKLSSICFILLPFAPLIMGFVVGFTRGLRLHDLTVVGPQFDFWVGTAAAVLQMLVLLRVQGFINRLSEDPDGLSNRRYSVWNGIWIVIGVLVWIVTYHSAYLIHAA